MLIGQSGYLNDSYLRFTEKDLSDAYNKGVKSLLVFQVQPDLTNINKQISELQKENEELNKKLDKVMRSALINKFLAEENQSKP